MSRTSSFNLFSLKCANIGWSIGDADDSAKIEIWDVVDGDAQRTERELMQSISNASSGSKKGGQ